MSARKDQNRIPNSRNAKAPIVECPPEFVAEIMKRGEEAHLPVIEKRNPQGAATALWMLCQGLPRTRIREQTGLSLAAINRLGFRHSDTLESKRKDFAMAYAHAAQTYTDLCMEKAERMMDNPEQLDNISPDRLALTVGIFTDKAAQLSGMASAIIEHRQGTSVEDAAKVIAEARARIAEKVKNQAIEAEVIN
jgi:hypothetical protein